MKAFVWHETDSFLHRLNPLTKLALSAPVVIVVSSTGNPLTPLAVAALALVATLALGRVPASALLRPFGFALLLAFGLFWTGTLFYGGAAGGAPLAALGPLRVTAAGLVNGTLMAGRLLAIFATSLLFVLTTDPTAFVLALIQQARLPPSIGYSVFAAYRFVPLFEVELGNVRAAHRLRGGEERSGPLGRLRAMLRYAVSLLAIAVRRGERVALAMDARAFGALPQRTYFRRTSVGAVDALFLLGAVLAIAVVVLGIPALGGLVPS